MSSIINVCCALHNISLQNDDILDDFALEEAENSVEYNAVDEQDNVAANQLRDRIAAQL